MIMLPKFLDPRGNLSFFESQIHVPFEILRTYLIYDVPGGEIRGGHAFKEQKEFIVALSGSFDVVVKDKKGKESRFHLNRSYMGLLIPNGIWRHLENFSTNSVCLVSSSTLYSADDYIRNLDDFLNK
ncbi:MAG TPA: FdtA/QdtA family cupin domain-containing protein [Catalimonadaceae bacterium]|nr:FdtA/QdtA family cupin domain-containing protein [Catalimonadaceae bacterium]